MKNSNQKAEVKRQKAEGKSSRQAERSDLAESRQPSGPARVTKSKPNSRLEILTKTIQRAIRDHQGSPFVDIDLANRLARDINHLIPEKTKLNYTPPPTTGQILAAIEKDKNTPWNFHKNTTAWILRHLLVNSIIPVLVIAAAIIIYLTLTGKL